MNPSSFFKTKTFDSVTDDYKIIRKPAVDKDAMAQGYQEMGELLKRDESGEPYYI